jgi:hypothetical protein
VEFRGELRDRGHKFRTRSDNQQTSIGHSGRLILVYADAGEAVQAAGIHLQGRVLGQLERQKGRRADGNDASIGVPLGLGGLRRTQDVAYPSPQPDSPNGARLKPRAQNESVTAVLQ